jgi:hypothetical protein
LAKPFWVTQFRIDDSAWTALETQASAKLTDPLVLAFEQGLINENHFISWERERSGLLSLKSVFFNGEPPRDLWMHYDLKVCTQSFAMPVGKWEDKTYWAKLSEAPTPMESQLKDVIWVLAPFSALGKWFSIWKSEVAVAPLFTDESSNAGTNHPLSDDSESIVLPELPEEYSGPPQGLGTLGTEKTLADIDFGTIKPLGTPTPPLSKDQEQTLDTTSTSTSASASTSLSMSVTGTQVDFMMPPLSKTIPPTGVRPSMSSNKLEDFAAPRNNPNIDVKLVPLDVISDRLKSASSQEEIANVIMGGWQNYFDRVMILLVQNGSLVVWRWCGSWEGELKKGISFELNTPSIFKITFGTLRAYHGHVSPGAINDHFFKIANRGQYPEHVDVAPVITDGQCVAMLVGCCTKEAGKKILVNKLEDQAALFATGLIKFLSTRLAG